MRGARAALVAVFALAACAPRPPAGTIHHLDDEYGLRQTRLESPRSSFANLVFVRNQNGLDCYRRANEPLEMGGVTLGYVHYCFYEDRLASITLWGAGSDTAEQLLNDLRHAYGKGQPLTAGDPRAKRPVGEIWSGRDATAVLLFRQRDNPQLDTSEVVVTVSSNRVLNKKDAAARTESAEPHSGRAE
jgi:hypothetical protein